MDRTPNNEEKKPDPYAGMTPQQKQERREQIIRRIKLMMEKAKGTASSGNTASEADGIAKEALIALSMARKLMEKYSIDNADVIAEEVDNAANLIDAELLEEWGYKPGKWPQYILWLAWAACTLFECEHKMVYDSKTGMTKIKVYGYELDVAVAQWLMEYMCDTIDKDGWKYWHSVKLFSTLSAQAVRNSFAEGAATEVQHRVRQMMQERNKTTARTSTGTALVVVKGAAIERKFGKFEYGSGESRARDVSAFMQGQVTGRRLNLSGDVIQQEPSKPQGRLPSS